MGLNNEIPGPSKHMNLIQGPTTWMPFAPACQSSGKSCRVHFVAIILITHYPSLGEVPVFIALGVAGLWVCVSVVYVIAGFRVLGAD